MPKQESQTSLPDQLLIKSTSSSSKSFISGATRAQKPKFKLRKPKSRELEKILKPKTAISKRYFTAGFGINSINERDVTKEPSSFEYPKDLEEFAHKVMTKAWRNDIRIKELKQKCSQRPSHKDRQKKDLLKRLYVEEPKVESMKTIIDIDSEYYTIVEGRPIPDKLDIREYIEIVRNSLKTKIINGFREDDIMLIDENLLLEQKIIDQIQENYKQYVDVFEEFLYRDHTSAMQLLKESEEAAKLAYETYEEYKAVTKQYGALRSSLYTSEEKWRNCKIYEQFLFMVSPVSWRTRKRSVLEDEQEFDPENLFSKYRMSTAETSPSLTDLLEQFNGEGLDDEKPELYFTSPEQLLDVFRFMEMQNLNSLLHSEELAIPLEQVKEGMRKAEELFDEEIRNLQETIDRLEGGISWEEERAKYLEELAIKLINDEFKKLIMDDEVLNLHVFVEDVYETRIGPNDANLSMAQMMAAIEAKYRNELLLLDKVPSEQVAMLEGNYYMEQMMVMRLAEKAAKQYKELESLTYRLGRAFAPPFEKKKGKELKKRSPPIEPRKPSTPPPRDLTEEEAEYLDFFTDYCKYTDDLLDYGIDTKEKSKKSEEEEGEDHNVALL